MTPEEQDAVFARFRQSLAGRKPPVQVLVVEDNPTDALDTTTKLNNAGISDITVARDTKETQDYLRTHDPWMVFLDMKLGTVSGLIVLDFIRLLKPHVEVAVLTGAYDHKSAECLEALRKGAGGVFLKPLSESTIRLLFTAP